MSDTRERLTVAKTYKLAIGGRFPRSESGRVYPVHSSGGAFRANAAQASRKDVRDAVAAAVKAADGWAATSPHNRGQVLYRVAEMLESRRAEFTALLDASGAELAAPDTSAVVDLAVDRLVWYAGWTDKIGTVLGSPNPVAGPLLSVSAPRPVGVVGVVCPAASPLLAAVSLLAPALAAGNACVVLASEPDPIPASTLAEVLATSDVPDGLVNVLSGSPAELAPWLVGHDDVALVDAPGADAELAAQLRDVAAAAAADLRTGAEPDFTAPAGPARLRACTRTTTLWHPVGA
ncbi:aldehyde dehydrogenase family protein [Salinifilum aidingensis]